jgi:hypothetical protein
MRYDVPIFDPVSDRGDDCYHPANDEAILLVHVHHTFQDLMVLARMSRHLRDKHERGLVSKYTIIELFSLDANVRHLANMVIQGRTEFLISDEVVARVKILWGRYHRMWRKHEATLKNVRDKLAAHREPLPLLAVAVMWDSIDPSTVEEIISHVPPFHDYLKDLDIFKWTKTEMTDNGEVTAFIQPFDGKSLTIPRRNARELAKRPSSEKR